MAYLALYREWRPRIFGEIIGQEHITRTLKNAVSAGRVGHAYLFCGARGTGKTTTARVLAKALNCPRREAAKPCNQCEVCRAVDEGFSMDVIEVDAASNRGIDEIRELREKINFAPATGKYRVYIIDEVHMLSNDAFNALLKTLEEPPRHGVFILATTEPHKVPLTILSRCQRFDFRRIVPADIIRRLKEVAAGAGLAVEEEALRLIARSADGGLRDALSILDQAAAFGGMKVTAEDVRDILGTVRGDALARMTGHLAAGEAGPALRLAAELAGEGKDLRLFAKELAGYLRALLLEKIAPGAAAGETWDDAGQMAAWAAAFTEEGLLRAVEIMAGVEQGMRFSTLPGVVLEVALVKACRPGSFNDVSALAARLAVLEKKLGEPAGRPSEIMDFPCTGKGWPPGATFLPPKQIREPAAGEKAARPGGAGQGPVAPAPFAAEVDGAARPAAPGRQETMATGTSPPGQGESTKSRPAPLGREDVAVKQAALLGREEVAATRTAPPRREEAALKGGIGEGGVSLEQVRESWYNIMETLRSERLPLYFNFTKAAPMAVKGRGLVVGFPEGEDLSREMAEQNKKYLEELLGRFFKGEWQVAFSTYQGKVGLPGKRPAAGKEPVADVKRRFGGEEINLEEGSGGTLF